MSNRRGRRNRPAGEISARPAAGANSDRAHQTTRRGARLDDTSVEVHETYYAGPLPSADELERYAALDPNAVTVILGHFNEQGRHRRAMEALVVEGSERRAGRGQFLAASLVVVGIVGGVVIALAGNAPVAGAGLGSASIGSAALIYIVGGRAPKAD